MFVVGKRGKEKRKKKEKRNRRGHLSSSPHKAASCLQMRGRKGEERKRKREEMKNASSSIPFPYL